MNLKTVNSINIEVFGDFNSVIDDAISLSSATTLAINFKWNSVNFSIKATDKKEWVWDYYQDQLKLSKGK